MIQTLRLTATIFSCCAVVGVALLATGRWNRSKGSQQEQTPLTNRVLQELRFKRIAIFDGKTTDGVRLADYIYKSSDCMTVSERTIFFKSPTRAREEIEKEIENASALIERGPKLDSNGQAVGERVVLEFAAEEQRKPHAEIMWNNGPELNYIIALSLEHTLELEKSLQSPNNGRVSVGLHDLQNLIFTPTQTSEGKTEQGFAYSEKQFRSSDCETIKVQTQYFDTPGRAQEEFEKNIREAINVIERAPKLNTDGEKIGERAVAVFDAGPSSESLDQTIIMWTENSQYHFIQGPFAHVLEFEKRYL
jgi:hypothetical protein